MKKRLSLIVALTLVLISLFTLGLSNKQVNAATLSDQEKVEQEINNIVMPEKAIIDFPVVSTSAYGSTITWESNNSAVLNVPQNGGWVVVTRPTDADAVVELKVTITLNQAKAENTFEILVPKGVTETNTYRINYVLNGGVQNASNPASYKVGTTPVLAAPTKGTVEFLGWYDNAEFEGSAMTQLPKGLSGDYTVYAKWAPTVLDSIEVTKAPTKVVYNALESFDPTGIEVEAHYNDGTSKELSLEEVQSITYDLNVLHYGNNKVVATYEGKTAEIAITVNKLQYDLSNVVFEDATKTYNGQAQTLTAEGVPAGLTAVVEGSATHVAEGAVTITLSFVNSNPDYEDVTEEITATLTITPASATVTARSATFKVGTTPTFSYSVSGLIGNDQLSGTAVYECAANNTSPAGDYPVKVSGLSNSDYVVTFVDGVITMNDGQYMIVVDDADLVKVYNGQNQMFTPRLMDGNTEIEGIEFTYSYNDVDFTGATDVKVYSVVVSFDSATYGSGSQTFTFEITARSLEQAWFEELPAVSYNGSAHTPDVVGKYNDKPLVKDVDYTLSYEANTQVGTATVTVTGKGNFKDSCDLHFVIRVADLERVQATRVELEQTYAALNGKLDKVEDLMVESTANETSIFWMSTSTAMSVSKEGKVSVILTSEEQTVVLYALITAGDAAEYAMFTVTLPKQASTSDENSNVTVEGVQEGAQVVVEQTNESESNYEVVGEDEEVIAGYEITLQQNNQTVQPMDEVTVKLPVPAGYNQDTLKVYYVNGEEQTNMNAHVEGEYLVFTTTHFSKYIVVGEPEQQQEETKITIAEFLEKEVNAEVYYELTGVISGIYNESYGNFYLVDQNDSSVQVLVYGLTATKVTSNDLSFASLGLNNGDVVTLMGTRADYKGTTQVGGPAYYVSHVSPEWTVEASSNGNGEVTLSSEKVENGDKVTLTFAPTEGYEASTMTVNGQEVGIKGQTSYEYQVLKDVEFVVTFAEIKENTGDENGELAVFEFGADDSSITSEDGKDGSGVTTYTETSNGYTLTLNNLNKVYKGSYDAKGNGCIKLGTTSAAGSFEFTVPENVQSVIIKVAGYKTNTAKITVNGQSYTISTTSANGEYTDVVVDTSSEKTVSFTTVSGGYRCKITSITFSGAAGEAPSHEHVECYICTKCTDPNCPGDDNEKCQGHDTLETITIAEFLTKSDSTTAWYQLTGIITTIKNTTYGNFTLVDQNDSSVSIYVYGLTATKVESNDQSFASLGLEEGDVVTLIGTHASYQGSAQVGGPAYYVSHVEGVTPSHEHDVCDQCGGCKASDCDGTLDACEGHSSSGTTTTKSTSVVIKDNGYANAETVETININDYITIILSKGSNSNTPKYYESGTAIRIYGGNTMTINSTQGKIVKVVITFGTSDGTNEIIVDNGTYSNGTWTGSSSSVQFTIDGTKGNRRIASIEVTYETNNN